jgi:pyruvate kinase
MFKHTKIVATIGPSCADKKTLTQMFKAGVNVARLNFSHGTYASHKKLINNIRAVEKELGNPVAIMQDLQGPKIRLGNMPDKGVAIKAGQKIIFNTILKEYKNGEFPIAYKGLQKSLKAGENFLIDDGHMEVLIEKIVGSKIYCHVIEGGTVLSHKGLNFPSSVLKVSALSEKDKDDLEFGVKAGIDLVALSFVHTEKDIINIKKLIKKFEKKLKLSKQLPILVIAKIERHEAIDHLDAIIREVDGLMVARGDLGLEMPASEVPLLQKTMIAKANAAAKPIIVATQMLDSMQHNRRPTRAEVSDVSNAVIDHADAVMLSNETASGQFPVLTVKTMAEIIRTTEISPFDDLPLPISSKELTKDAITELSRVLSFEVDAKLIVAASISGETGRLIARVRPAVPILVATSSKRVQRQLNLSWGVIPFILHTCKHIEELVAASMAYIQKAKLAKKGDKIVVVAGEPVGDAGTVNLVEVRQIK